MKSKTSNAKYTFSGDVDFLPFDSVQFKGNKRRKSIGVDLMDCVKGS